LPPREGPPPRLSCAICRILNTRVAAKRGDERSVIARQSGAVAPGAQFGKSVNDVAVLSGDD
jgi:hypothetical protein